MTNEITRARVVLDHLETDILGALFSTAPVDQDEQKRWSTAHHKAFGHRTQDYFRRLPDREES